MGGLNRVEVINSKGCSRLFAGFSSSMPSFRNFQSVEPMSPASTSLGSEPSTVRSTGPFSGLVICVTGLSKEARKQVMEAAERLGGQYSPSLHPQLRLSESLYTVKGVGEHRKHVDELNRLVKSPASESSCLPSGFHEAKKLGMIEKPNIQFSERVPNKSMDSMLSGHTVYVESDISDELRNKTCQTPIHAISPSILLDSICWSISEPTSSASIYTDSFSSEDVSDHQSVFFDANGYGKDPGASFTNLTRSLTESEKNELIFRNQFLTILFPVDRFSEMGPSSRTYFSHNGFTCLQVLDYIYAFYQVLSWTKFSYLILLMQHVQNCIQLWESSEDPRARAFSNLYLNDHFGYLCLLMSLKENMTAHEIESAIYTDSRHADRLRAVYSSRETVECGYAIFKRIDFLGSRKSFEMLKRVSWDNNSNVYELLVRA
ncbi:hypothetical protein V6N13_098610 [Hibiscus sabdariffa]|uniref:BRCT domain-containing protein n=1 Tax=Hibiscus sabdariffa TaxID=183260 RepID=A0ABR2EED3_9ROSI